MQIKKRFIFLGLIIVFLILLFFPALIQILEEKNIYSSSESIAPHEVVIVFGAGLNKNGRPSDALADRLITAAALYKNATVKKILVSGDNVTDEYYNEPDAMTEFLIDLEIPETAITQDYAGARTYDTCIRAKEIWGIEEAILVTQAFHLPRALFTCNALGIASIGVIADLQPYIFEDYYDFREWMATYKAFIDVYIKSPDYISGEAEIL